MMRSLSQAVRLIVCTAGLLCALLAPAPGALAAADDPKGDTTAAKATFGIGPTRPGPAGQVVDGRPYFDYRASAGATVRDAVAVINYGTEPLKLRIYATDATQGEDGSFGLLASDDTPMDAGSWFKLEVPPSGTITVPPRQGSVYGRVEVPLEVKIPADATPGDHVAGVIASLDSESKDKKGTRIKLEQRVAVRTYFRIDGPLEPRLEIAQLHTSYTANLNLSGRGTTTVTYQVRNTGNVRMDAAQIVDVSGWFEGSTIERPAPVQDLLPGSSLDVTHTFQDDFAIGQLDSLVSLIATPVDTAIPADRTPVQEHTTIWAWPWPLMLFIGAIVLLLALAGYVTWRRRRRTKLARADTLVGSSDAGKLGARDRGPLEPVSRSVRAVAVGAALAAVGLLGPLPPAHADVTQPDGGRIILEPERLTADPSRAQTEGVWGHEGKGGNLGTFVAADLTDASGQVTDASQKLWLERFGLEDFADVGIAFVPASKDGSTERPAVSPGENAGDAFEWFTFASFGSGLTGTTNPETNQVLVVHTMAEYNDWVLDGKPEQVFDERFVAHDVLREGVPVSAHPQGKSVQNRWAAGQEISLVMFEYDGFDAAGVPVLTADEAGRARTVWLTFETVASTTTPSVATSAGYRVMDTSPLPKEPEEVPEALTATVAEQDRAAENGEGASDEGADSDASESDTTGPGATGSGGAESDGAESDGAEFDGTRSDDTKSGLEATDAAPGQDSTDPAAGTVSNGAVSDGSESLGSVTWVVLALGALAALVVGLLTLRRRSANP